MQMTADDMRISDWSSDVCSSDLDEAAAGAGAFDAATLGFRAGDGTLVFNHSDDDYIFSTALDSAGLVSTGPGTHRVEHYAGQTRLTGDSSAFSGTTIIHGGQEIGRAHV